jgi:hypothetical protein
MSSGSKSKKDFRDMLCGSVHGVQKTARSAVRIREFKRFLQVCGGWHARCIKGQKLNSLADQNYRFAAVACRYARLRREAQRAIRTLRTVDL